MGQRAGGAEGPGEGPAGGSRVEASEGILVSPYTLILLHPAVQDATAGLPIRPARVTHSLRGTAARPDDRLGPGGTADGRAAGDGCPATLPNCAKFAPSRRVESMSLSRLYAVVLGAVYLLWWGW